MTIQELYNAAQECTYNDSPTFNVGKAIELFSKVIELDPNYSMALENRSQCYHRLGMHEERLQDLIEILKRIPDERQAIRAKVNVAECLESLGRKGEALTYVDGLDLDPQQMSTFALRMRERLYRAANMHAKADLDQKQANDYDAEQKALWDDPNYYGHYK